MEVMQMFSPTFVKLASWWRDNNVDHYEQEK